MPVAVVDDAALRILRQLVRFGQGRDPRDYAPDVIGSRSPPRLAREAAQKSIVLLKNERQRAAAREACTDVTLFGRLADMPNIGDHGSSTTQPAYVVTPLQGLRAALGAPFRVQYEEGSDLARAAAAAAGAATWRSSWWATPARDEGEYLSSRRRRAVDRPLPEAALHARGRAGGRARWRS